MTISDVNTRLGLGRSSDSRYPLPTSLHLREYRTSFVSPTTIRHYPNMITIRSNTVINTMASSPVYLPRTSRCIAWGDQHPPRQCTSCPCRGTYPAPPSCYFVFPRAPTSARPSPCLRRSREGGGLGGRDEHHGTLTRVILGRAKSFNTRSQRPTQ